MFPWGRALLLIDNTADLPLLEQTLSEAWARMSAEPPNRRGGQSVVRLLRLHGDLPVEWDRSCECLIILTMVGQNSFLNIEVCQTSLEAGCAKGALN